MFFKCWCRLQEKFFFLVLFVYVFALFFFSFFSSNPVQYNLFFGFYFFLYLFLFRGNKRKKMSMSSDGAGSEAQNRESWKEACLTKYCLWMIFLFQSTCGELSKRDTWPINMLMLTFFFFFPSLKSLNFPFPRIKKDIYITG